MNLNLNCYSVKELTDAINIVGKDEVKVGLKLENLIERISHLQGEKTKIENSIRNLKLDEDLIFRATLAISSLDLHIKTCTDSVNKQLNDAKANLAAAVHSNEQMPLAFPKEDLITFRSALQSEALRDKFPKGFDVMINHEKFKIWYNDTHSSINIQKLKDWTYNTQNNKLGVVIDPSGKITSIWIDGKPQVKDLSVPATWTYPLQGGFKEALKIASTYQKKAFLCAESVIFVEAVRRGLKEIPAFHLLNFADWIVKLNQEGINPKIEVTFLNDDMTKSFGKDGGGLSRDYLDELVGGLIQCKELPFEKVKNTSLFLPQTKALILEKEERDLLHALGSLLMYCFKSETQVEGPNQTAQIGHHFDLSLFSAALCLTAEEINTPFEKLSDLSLMKMAKVLLLRKKELDGSNAMATQYEYLDPLSILMGEKKLDRECIELFSDCIDWEGPVVTEDQVHRFKAKLLNYILDGSKVANQLAPIHAIAQGMKAVCDLGFDEYKKNLVWNYRAKITEATDFSYKVQGSLNRQLIAQSLIPEGVLPKDAPEINKKVKWIQEWLEKEATEEELITFLKYATGSSGLPANIHIGVVAHIGTKEDPHKPFPEAHTCSLKLRISPVPCSYGEHNDYTKANYIKSLKEIALANKSVYNME